MASPRKVNVTDSFSKMAFAKGPGLVGATSPRPRNGDTLTSADPVTVTPGRFKDGVEKNPKSQRVKRHHVRKTQYGQQEQEQPAGAVHVFQ